MSDRVNRAVLVVIALLLITGGAATLAAATGMLSLGQPSELYGSAAASAGADPGIWWAVAIAGCVVLLLLTATWALRQVLVRRPGDGLSTVTIDQTDRGRTTIEAVKVAQAAAADLERVPSVTASSARLVDDGDGRQLRTRIDVLTDADLAAVRRATDEVYERVSGILGDDPLRTKTRIRPIGGRPPRVR